jgi:uncharacterized protein YvpB
MTVPTRSHLVRSLAALALFGTIAVPSVAEAAHEITMPRLKTPFFIPPLEDGDADFFGHRPKSVVDVELEVRNGNELVAKVGMSAVETGNNSTKAIGRGTFTIAKLPAGQTIEAILSPTRTKLEYTDKDHEEDYLVPGQGEVRPDRWTIPGASEGPVRMARLVGDTNGGEAGSRTGVQFFFKDIKLRVSGTAATTQKLLAVSDAERTTFTNGCAANSGWRVLKFYGRNISHRSFYDKVASSGNLVSDNNWGVPPGTLAARLVENGAKVKAYRVTTKGAAIDAVIKQIDLGRPIIALTGWGGKTVRDMYAPAGDTVSWDAGASTLHYVVVRGYDKHHKQVFVLDNGTPKTWSYDYFASVLFWTPEVPHAIALFEAIEVRTGMLIY